MEGIGHRRRERHTVLIAVESDQPLRPGRTRDHCANRVEQIPYGHIVPLQLSLQFSQFPRQFPVRSQQRAQLDKRPDDQGDRGIKPLPTGILIS